MPIKSGYTAEDLARMGPDVLTRKKLLAEAMLADATKQRKIEHPLQGFAQMAEVLAGGLDARKIDEAEGLQRDQRQTASKAMLDGLFGGGEDPQPGATGGDMPSVSPTGDVPVSGGSNNYRDAIASIESAGSGDYAAVGPTHPKMGRALGRYQIMEANIGPWSKAALGREVTPDEFMSNPELQDAIFDKQFGGYVEKFGPEGAAQAWFAGPGGVGKTNRKDVLGTDVGTYGQKFVKALGRSGQPNSGAAAIEAIAPSGGLSDEVAEFQQTPAYTAQFPGQKQPFDAGRFDDTSRPAVGVDEARKQLILANALADTETQQTINNVFPRTSGTGGQQLPPEFAGSQQLQSAMQRPQGSIIQALMADGPQASPQQLAQARAGGMPQARPQNNRALIESLLGNPATADMGEKLLQQEIEQQQQARDPMRQMQLEKGRLELEALRNPQVDPMKVGQGERVFDPRTGKVLFEGQPKAEAKPSAIQEYEYAKEQGFPGTFQDWEASKKGGMALNVGPNGEVTFQQGGNIKPMTEGQSKDAVYSTRAEGALSLIDQFGDSLTGAEGVTGATVGQVPVVGNFAKTEGYQQAEQAGNEFLQAVLRKDTGAAITSQEMKEYGTVYLPRPGDTPAVLEQKKTSRRRALEAIKAGMPPQAILAQEKALANTDAATQKSTDTPDFKSMTDEELQRYIDGQ